MKNTKKLVNALKVIIAGGKATPTSFSFKQRNIESEDANAFSRIFTTPEVKLYHNEFTDEEVVVIPLLNPLFDYNPYDIKSLIEDVLMENSPFNFADIYKTYSINGIEAYTGFNTRMQYSYNILLATIANMTQHLTIYKDEYEYTLYTDKLGALLIAVAYAQMLSGKSSKDAAKIAMSLVDQLIYVPQLGRYFSLSNGNSTDMWKEINDSVSTATDNELVGYLNDETSEFEL